jgi:hypothetical protein
MVMTDETTNTTENSAEQAEDVLNTFIEHQRRALEETGKALETLLPPGFKEHSQEAGKEFAKGFKVLADAALKELDKLGKNINTAREAGEEGDRPSTTGPTKVKVQVE